MLRITTGFQGASVAYLGSIGYLPLKNGPSNTMRKDSATLSEPTHAVAVLVLKLGPFPTVRFFVNIDAFLDVFLPPSNIFAHFNLPNRNYTPPRALS
jgi:hypothetical protein